MMGVQRRFLATLLPSLLLLGTAQTGAVAELLSAEAVRQVLGGATIVGISRRGTDFIMEFSDDGTVAGTIDQGYRWVEDDGEWSVNRKGKFCFKWSRFAKARKWCFFLEPSGDGKALSRVRRDGSHFTKGWVIRKSGPGTEQALAALPAATRTRKRPARVVKTDRTPPSIDLPPSISTDSSTVRIAGRVRDDSQVVELAVNGRPVPVAGDGSFRIGRAVPVGRSALIIAAVDE